MSTQQEETVRLGTTGGGFLPTITAILIFHVLYFIIPIASVSLPFVLLLTRYWHVPLIVYPIYYLFIFATSKPTGRPFYWVVNVPPIRYMFEYFPSSLTRVGPRLDPKQTYIFGVHPHGVVAFNRIVLAFGRQWFWDRLFPGIQVRTLTATAALMIPFVRELFIASGCVDASRPVAEKVLKAGMSFIVYPGGEKEQIETQQGRDMIYIKKRQGFIRLALKYGAHLVPAYCFGDSELFYCSSIFRGLRHWLVDNVRVALPLFWGRFLFLPRIQPMDMVVGVPIPVEKNENPTQEDIDALHQKYIEAVQNVYDTYKGRFGFENRKLEIW